MHRVARTVLIAVTVVVGLITIVALVVGGTTLIQDAESDARQRALDPFYTPPDPIPDEPGLVLRSEPLSVDGTPIQVPGAQAHRLLYVSQRPDDSASVSGAMIFIPDNVQPDAPIVAWAHGTVGQGDACAPSRSKNPIQDSAGWLTTMVENGWVVVATDYTGLGTPGPNLYLVGEAEARDVVNAVRAARNMTSAGSRYVVWGHSQGGHSSLWTGHLGPELAPELDLLGVAAAAPAAELTAIVRSQWVVPYWGWALGPEILQSWLVMQPDLPNIVTDIGLRDTPRIAETCIVRAGLEGQARGELGERFFTGDPMQSEPWRAYADAQSVPPLPPEMPAFLGQSTADTIVLAWPNALLQERWCAAQSNLNAVWLSDVSHQDTATVLGPQAVSWIAARFAGLPNQSTCPIGPPIPASPQP